MYELLATSIKDGVASPLQPSALFPGPSHTPPEDSYVPPQPGVWTSLMDPLAFVPLVVLLLTTVRRRATHAPHPHTPPHPTRAAPPPHTRTRTRRPTATPH
eukprot:4883559-Prymnesium_polylepis.1